MRMLRAPLVALVTGLLLVGCSSSDAEPTEQMAAPTSPTATSATVESPTSWPSAVPSVPALPRAATRATEDGARAFIAYYWELVNYAQATGDVTALREASGRHCAGCHAGIDGVTRRYGEGTRVVGGDHTIRIREVSRLAVESGELNGYRVHVDAAHNAQTEIAADGTETQRRAGHAEFDLFLIWIDKNGWRVDAMEVR